MDSLSASTAESFRLLFSGDAALWVIIFTSFSVSVRAILIAAPLAFVVAFLMAHLRYRGRRTMIAGFSALQSIPAVVVGLTVYLVLSRSGPLGDLQLLFTHTSMIIGQILLSFPLLVALSHAAFQAADRRVWETSVTLGAKPARAFLTLIHEIRFGLIAALLAGFGRIIAEVGCSMMVGGNILGYTRNIPTAIALETTKGEFAQAIALGMVLLALALLLNGLLAFFQGRGVMSS
ncbi:MAG: ABC transporter permease [Gammaproteobacteria bacterium]|nr:ABC transporter permease [Gammaproteobacteria bacterium]